MTTLYKKQGRRYVPVAEYTPEWDNHWPDGAHLVVSKPGSTSRRYKINPAFAPMIAAGHYATEAMVDAIVNSSKAKPNKTPLTPEQLAAWRALEKVFGGDELMYLQYPSAYDALQAGIEAMQQEADKQLKNPAVKQAWEQFMLVWELCKTEENKHD